MPAASGAPPLQRGDHRGRELEAQEMHGRGLLVVLALQILVGDREARARGRATCTQQRSLDAAQLRQRRCALDRVRDTRSAASPSSCCRPESAGCRRRAPRAMPAGSKMRSTRSISCTWYCIVSAVLEASSVQCGAQRAARAAPLVRDHARAERGALARVLLEAAAGRRRRACHGVARRIRFRRRGAAASAGASGSRARRQAALRSGGRPSGSRSSSGRRRGLSTRCTTGRAIFTRGVAEFASSPRRCRRGRSSARSTSTVVPGTSRSTSRVFRPMFCTRRWQGTW